MYERDWVNMNICPCVPVYIHVYSHAYMHMSVYMPVSVYMSVCLCACECVYMFLGPKDYACYVCIHVSMFVCVYECV